MQVPGTKPQFEMPGPKRPQIEPTYIAMAAAQMAAEGRWPQPVSDRVYEDNRGHQRSLSNDRVLQDFEPQIDEMANSLDDVTADALEKHYNGGKLSPKESEVIKPFQEKAREAIKDLPSETRDKDGGIRMKNWDTLFMDQVIDKYRAKGRGV